jgi:hypothetical protein
MTLLNIYKLGNHQPAQECWKKSSDDQHHEYLKHEPPNMKEFCGNVAAD